MQTVAVFFGGNSNEYDISVITGLYAANLLKAGGYGVLPVLLGRSGGAFDVRKAKGVTDFAGDNKFPEIFFCKGGFTARGKRGKCVFPVDCALICCHGGLGEDGTLAAVLDYYQIPNASPEMPASAVFMNKEYSQIAAKGLDIPVVPSFTVGEKDGFGEALARAETIGYPLIVKPSRLGSSIGIGVAQDEEGLRTALQAAFRLDDSAVVERYLAGKRDINCAAYFDGDRVRLSECEEVFSQSEILTFAEKYGDTGMRNARMPAELPEEAALEIKRYTELIYRSFHLRGIVRADFLYADGKVYFNELNTVPGSLACYLFGETLTQAKKLLVGIVERRLGERREIKQTVSSDLLQSSAFTPSGGSKRSAFGI